MRRHRDTQGGFTLVDAIVVVIAMVVVVVTVNTCVHIPRGHINSPQHECINNLKNIYACALTYRNRTTMFPLGAAADGPPRAHESLNVLLRSTAGRDLPAKLFACPAGEAVEAEVPQGEKFPQLDEDTLSYTWITTPVHGFGERPQNLSSDKYVDGWQDHYGHEGKVMLLKTDNSIHEVELDELGRTPACPRGWCGDAVARVKRRGFTTERMG